MTQTVNTVGVETPILDAAKIMLQLHVSGLPVINKFGALVGIISQSDFMRRAEIGTQQKRGRWLNFFVGPGKVASDFVHEQGRKVGEIMTADPYTATEETPLDDIVQIMQLKNIKRLPVVREGKLVGIVTRTDLLQAFAAFPHNLLDQTADDDVIRSQIMSSIEKTDWRPFGLGVIVHDGVVHLSGVMMVENARQAAIVAAENVPGVQAVHDHLCWVDPMSGMYLNSQEDENSLKSR